MLEKSLFKIRKMHPSDLAEAFRLSSVEGWNQTEKDWQFLHENPGDLSAVAEKDGRVAGTATAINYGNMVAWIGMVIVDKSLRGHGAGKMLLENMITGLRHVESIKLDATPAGEPLYTKLGFLPEYGIHRMTRESGGIIPAYGKKSKPVPVKKDKFHEITDLDCKIFGADRQKLLEYLFQNSSELAFYTENDEGISGYVFGRKGIRFSYIGPLCAGSDNEAFSLLAMVLGSTGSLPVAIDVPGEKTNMIKWLESAGFILQRHFMRMYLGQNPYPGQVDLQYLISGPEFG
jgi:GNAT superfamily N-acetyltransferase